MTRGWLGAGLLAALLILGLFIGSAMNTFHSAAGDLLDTAAEKALAGDFTGAEAAAQEAKAHWMQNRKSTAVIADHTPMEDVDALFAEMEVYAQTGELPHFIAICRELSQRINAVSEAHQFNWWNIL